MVVSRATYSSHMVIRCMVWDAIQAGTEVTDELYKLDDQTAKLKDRTSVLPEMDGTREG